MNIQDQFEQQRAKLEAEQAQVRSNQTARERRAADTQADADREAAELAQQARDRGMEVNAVLDGFLDPAMLPHYRSLEVNGSTIYVFTGHVRPLYVDTKKGQLSLGSDGTLYYGAGAASNRRPLLASDGSVQPAKVRGGAYDLTIAPPDEANDVFHSDAFVTAIAERTLAGRTVVDQISAKRRAERTEVVAHRSREETLRAERHTAEQANEDRVTAQRTEYREAAKAQEQALAAFVGQLNLPLRVVSLTARLAASGEHMTNAKLFFERQQIDRSGQIMRDRSGRPIMEEVYVESDDQARAVREALRNIGSGYPGVALRLQQNSFREYYLSAERQTAPTHVEQRAIDTLAQDDAHKIAQLPDESEEVVVTHTAADHEHHEREHAAVDSVAERLRPAIDRAVKATDKSGRPKSFRMIGPLNSFGNWKFKRAVRTGLHDDILPINSADRALAELADDYPNHTLTCKQDKHGGVVIYVERKPTTPRT